MRSPQDYRIAHRDHELAWPGSADWQSAVSHVANLRHSRLPISATNWRRLMESLLGRAATLWDLELGLGAGAARRQKAAVNAPHSRRFAIIEGAGRSRQRLECGGFSTAFGPRFMESRTQTCGDWEAWLRFFRAGVQETANQAGQTAKALMKLAALDAQRIQTIGKASGSALRVHRLLQAQPILSIASAGKELKLSVPTAASALKHSAL